MPDRMNLDYLKLLNSEFQKYEVMIMSVVGGQPKKKKHGNTSYKATNHIQRTFLISDYHYLVKLITSIWGNHVSPADALRSVFK